MSNTWTPKQEEELDRIERDLIESGTPERQARLQAEQKLEGRLERQTRTAELGS